MRDLGYTASAQDSRARLEAVGVKGVPVAITAYLDSSGKHDDPFVTLAAFVADDGTWADFGAGWDEVLKSGFQEVSYIHMTEAVHRQPDTPFSYKLGWTRKHVWELVFKLAEYMNRFKGGFVTMHSCEVDMEAWRRLIKQGLPIPSEVDLCNRYVSEYIVGMFANKLLSESESETISLASDGLLSFIFDRNEPFIGPFSQKVNNEKDESERSRKASIWQLVDGITEDQMKSTPGLQAADILAWGVNRQNAAIEGKEGKHLAYILRQLVMCTWKEYDEAAMCREFYACRSRTRPTI
jgi:Protein of unknown function (DUF3800)